MADDVAAAVDAIRATVRVPIERAVKWLDRQLRRWPRLYDWLGR